MKQKRKYHDISDNESDTSVGIKSAKRIKILHSSIIDQIDPEEDEVWLVRLPGHLNPDQLYDQKLKLKEKKSDTGKVCKVEANEKYYEAQVTNWTKDNDKLTVLKQGEHGLFIAASLECKGEINFIEEIKVPLIGDIEVPPKAFVEPPKNLHWRHPFFGQEVQNTDQVLDPSPVQMQIKSEFEESKNKKSKKKSKNCAVDEVRLEDGILKKVKSEPGKDETPGKKKKHKRKREES